MSIKISSAGKEIFYSGNIITFGLGESRFDLHHNGEDLSFIFEFVDEEGTDVKMRRDFELVNETTGKIIFYNYLSPHGSYTKEPIVLGSIGKRQLFLQYRIDNLESKSKIFFYTFYLGEEVENGED